MMKSIITIPIQKITTADKTKTWFPIWLERSTKISSTNSSVWFSEQRETPAKYSWRIWSTERAQIWQRARRSMKMAIWSPSRSLLSCMLAECRMLLRTSWIYAVDLTMPTSSSSQPPTKASPKRSKTSTPRSKSKKSSSPQQRWRSRKPCHNS